MQAAASFIRCDFSGLTGEDGAGVEPGFHHHGLHAGHLVASHDGALDRRSAAPAWQEGGVNVHAAKPGRIQNGLRQDEAIGDHHSRIEAQLSKSGLLIIALERSGRAYLDALFLGIAMHWGRGQLLAASGRARRLGIDAGDLMARLDQGGEDGHGEIRASHKGDTEFLAHGRGFIGKSGPCKATGCRLP